MVLNTGVCTMIHAGVASVTFRQLSTQDIVALTAEAGLTSIEWGGDVHVPPGDANRAAAVGDATRAAGLTVASYGAYYRAGSETDPYPDFARTVATAQAIGAPLIRVWAGGLPSSEADDTHWESVTQAFRGMGDLAGEAGLGVGIEFHPGTLTDTAASAVRLLEATNQANVSSYWQVEWTWPPLKRLESLKSVSPWLSNVHAFHRQPDSTQLALAEGMDEWRTYLGYVAALGGTRHVLLEFVADDDVARFLEDAATLLDLLDELG